MSAFPANLVGNRFNAFSFNKHSRAYFVAFTVLHDALFPVNDVWDYRRNPDYALGVFAFERVNHCTFR